MLLPKPRLWQTKALSAWQSAGFRGTTQVVTGGGKTVFALQCDQVVRADQGIGQTLILVPTEALLYQWKAAILSCGVADTDISLAGSGQRLNAKSPYIIAISRSWRQLLLLPDLPRFLVVDEVHHIATVQARKCLAIPASASLGLSATPDRQYDPWMSQFVYPVVGGIVFSYSFREALADGVVSAFRFHCVEIPATADEERLLTKDARTIAVAISRGDNARLTQALLARSRHSNSVAARVYAASPIFRALGLRRGIVFAADIASAEDVAARLRAQGHLAQAYHSKLTKTERFVRIRLYYLKQINVLVTCAALDEGFDVPDTEFAFLLASTASMRRRIQRMGRALRPTGAESVADIVSFYVTESERTELQSYTAEYHDVAETRWLQARPQTNDLDRT